MTERDSTELCGKRLDGKVAIVTGATSGIGKASAELFAAEGAKVVVAGRNRERGTTVVDEIKDRGGDAIFVAVDMLEPDDLDRLLKTTIEAYGRLDILFNNAGIAQSYPLESFKEEDWDYVMRTNLRAPFLMSKKAIPYLRRTRGTVLNTASISGLRPDPMGYAYNTSKAALIMMTRVLAKDFAADGIRANALCPGVTETPILQGGDERTQNAIAALIKVIPMGRLADPADIAKAALFLVSDDASYITGQALTVDGGLTL